MSLAGCPEAGFLVYSNHAQLYLLDFASLGRFRLSSRSCRIAADPFFYRTLSLRDCRNHDDHNLQFEVAMPYALLHIERLIKRLSDPNDDLRLYVRHLRIGPFKMDVLPQKISADNLIDMFDAFTNLQDFRFVMMSMMLIS